MPLTAENLLFYLGGQVEIVRLRENIRYKGDITAVALTANTLTLRLAKLAYTQNPSGASNWAPMKPRIRWISLFLTQYVSLHLPGNVRHFLLPGDEVIKLLPKR